MGDYSELIDKTVAIIFDDGNAITKKVGILKTISPDYIQIFEKNSLQLIPTHRIVRIERVGEKDG